MSKIEREKAVYYLYLKDKLAAYLHKPQMEDMFWCSYEIVAVDHLIEKELMKAEVWDKIEYSIKDNLGKQANENTFTPPGQYFHPQSRNRLHFRSLWPPKSDKRKSLIDKLKIIKL